MAKRPDLSGRIIDDRENENPTKLGFAGTIRIGEKRTSQKTGNEYPIALDHFRMDARPEYVEYFKEAYGEKPTKLEIMFFSDDPKESCYDRFELRDKAGKLYGISNGIIEGATFFIWNKNDWKKITEENLSAYGGVQGFMDSAATHCESKQGWQRRLTLSFLLPQIPKVIGYYKLHTGGKLTSIENLVGMFDTVKKARGSVVLVPFDLTVIIAKADRTNDPRQYPVLDLVCNRGFNEGLAAGNETKLLEPINLKIDRNDLE